MPKYYVKSGKEQKIIQSDYPVIAAVSCYIIWLQEHKKLKQNIRVSEVGFGDEHPHHIKDCVFSKSYIRLLAK